MVWVQTEQIITSTWNQKMGTNRELEGSSSSYRLRLLRDRNHSSKQNVNRLLRMILCLKHKTDNIICVMVPLHSYFPETSHIFLKDALKLQIKLSCQFQICFNLAVPRKGLYFQEKPCQYLMFIFINNIVSICSNLGERYLLIYWYCCYVINVFEYILLPTDLNAKYISLYQILYAYVYSVPGPA